MHYFFTKSYVLPLVRIVLMRRFSQLVKHTIFAEEIGITEIRYLPLSRALLSEKDVNGDILWTWSYPSVTSKQRALFTRKSCLTHDEDSFTPFLYSQLDRKWYYIYTCSTEEQDNLPKVQHFSTLLSLIIAPDRMCTINFSPYCLSRRSCTVS